MIPPIAKMMVRNLLRGPATRTDDPDSSESALRELADSLGLTAQVKLGRSLAIRAIDAGSCNGCELEMHAVNHPVYDLERLGVKFVASPRHADVLMITGPVSWNMAEAMRRTIEAAPEPRWVVALGDCAVNGGCFAGSYAVAGGAAAVVPVDMTIPGCPPEPRDIIAGLLALLDAVEG